MEGYSLSAMFARSREKTVRLEQMRLKEMSEDTELIGRKDKTVPDVPIPLACASPLLFREQQTEKCIQALIDLEKLLNSIIKQEKKYRCRLLPQTNFFQRHLMVKQFLNIQKRRLPSQTC